MPRITKEITLSEAEKIVDNFLEECRHTYDGYTFTCAELLEEVGLHTQLNLSEAELSTILGNLLNRGVIKDTGITPEETIYAIIYL